MTDEDTHDAESMACPVCAEMAIARKRHWFWVFAEKLGDGSFLTRLRRGGGYCVRHARELLSHEQAERTARAFQFVLRGWQERLAAPTVIDCPACSAEADAEEYALKLLARGEWSGDQQAHLDAEGLLCLPHARALVERVPLRLFPEAVAQLRRSVKAVVDAVGLDETTGIAAGHSYDEAFRTHDHCEETSEQALSFAAIDEALDAHWCPLCLAGRRASAGFVRWLGEEERSDRDRDDFARLCSSHLWDALANSRPAAEAAVTRIRETWDARMRALAGVATDEEAGRGLLERVLPDRAHASRLQQILPEEACAACVASTTAVERTLSLLEAYLLDADGSARYLRSDGLCLAHAGVATARLRAEAAAVVAERARALLARHLWNLDEALRKMSWSVRYEPDGREVDAWRAALVFVGGRAVTCGDWLAPVPRYPERAM